FSAPDAIVPNFVGKDILLTPKDSETLMRDLAALADKLLHQDLFVWERRQHIRSRHVSAYNRRFAGPIALADFQFSPGDYVLVSRKGVRKGDKLRLWWTGPFLVTDIIGDNLYRVTNLLGKSYDVHSCRIRFYE